MEVFVTSKDSSSKSRLMKRWVKVFLAVLFDQVWFREKYYTPQVRPDRDLNSWPLDCNSRFHVTETPALTTWPSVTLPLWRYLLEHDNDSRAIRVSVIFTYKERCWPSFCSARSWTNATMCTFPLSIKCIVLWWTSYNRMGRQWNFPNEPAADFVTWLWLTST